MFSPGLIAYSTVLAARGIFGGGGPGPSNVINYIDITTAANATSFGTLATAGQGPAGCASSTRGVFMGRDISGTASKIMSYITIATTGNDTSFGNLIASKDYG